jgi:hypothetical protein
MRRVHLRGHDNILKRLLIHVGGYNLSLVLRLAVGKGTPRGLQDLATLSLFAYILLTRLYKAQENISTLFPAFGDSYEHRQSRASQAQTNPQNRDY